MQNREMRDELFSPIEHMEAISNKRLRKAAKHWFYKSYVMSMEGLISLKDHSSLF